MVENFKENTNHNQIYSKMELNNILVISGKPDLSEVISQTKNGAIVKNLVTGVKFPVFRNERISSLGEIRIYTTDGEAPLEDVFAAMYKKEDAKPLGFDPKKAEPRASPSGDLWHVMTMRFTPLINERNRSIVCSSIIELIIASFLLSNRQS